MFLFVSVGKVEPNCAQYVLTGGSVGAGAKVFVHIKESPRKKMCLLRLVDVKYTEREEKSVYPEEGWGRGAGC